MGNYYINYQNTKSEDYRQKRNELIERIDSFRPKAPIFENSKIVL